MFIGENLTNLRILHGHSRKQLSEILGITEQAVWQYENNYTSPKMKTMNDLKSIFHVKSKYFYNEDVLARYTENENIPFMNIAYRSEIMNVISKTQTEAKHVEFLDGFINYITKEIAYPTYKIIALRDKAIDYLNTSQEDRNVQIEKIAELARKFLGLRDDTNDNLMFLVEKSGVFIFEKAIGEKIDAYSLWTNRDRPFIVLGNLKRSAVRRNFDIAHELGHLLLHYRVEFTSLDRTDYKRIENEANQFAGAFLLPKEPFLADMHAVKRITNPDAYMDLKEKWQTSLQVLGYRAYHLAILDARSHRNYYASCHRKGYLKCEPLDETIPIKRPQKVKTIFDLVIQKGIIDMRRMLENDWMVDMPFFHQITGIDTEFFNRYMKKEQNFEIAYLHDSAGTVQK